MDKKDKIKKNVPSYFKPDVNVMWKALLEAHGIEDQNASDQVIEAKKQIFVEFAEKEYLDALGDNVAVYRPLELNLADEKYRKLIEFLSFYPKQVKSLISNILDVFYDEVFSRFNTQTQLSAPYGLTGGESLVFRTEKDKPVKIVRKFTANGDSDGPNTIRINTTAGLYIGQLIDISDDSNYPVRTSIVDLTNSIITISESAGSLLVSRNALLITETYQYTIFKSSDFANPGAATAGEVVNAINKSSTTVTASEASSNTIVSIRTNTVGNKGYLQVLGGTANNYLSFPVSPAQNLRIQISEINPNELVIKIPSTIPALRRILQGSAHLHPDSTTGTNWKGSFVYDPNSDYTVQKMRTSLNQNIVAGQVYTQISVLNSSNIPNEAGNLIFNFGRERMEYSVPYIGRPNNSTLLVDPSYVFKKDHVPGELINTIITTGTVPRVGGMDYPVYLVGVETARELVQNIVRGVVATGVVIRWEITYPICGKF